MALDEKLVAVKLHAVGVVDRFAGLDADHHVLRVRVVFAEVVAVVGRDQRQAEIFFQLERSGWMRCSSRQALVLNLEKEIALAENVGKVPAAARAAS